MAENTQDTVELTDDDWESLEELASHLEDAWKKGGPVDLATFLPDAASPLRKAALHELIKVDLECRWTKGQPVVLDYYIDKFPELGRPRDLPPRLIYEEYRVRQLRGDRPQLDLYKTRFPTQFEQLQKFLTDEPIPTVVHVGTIGKAEKKKAVSKTKQEDTVPEHLFATVAPKPKASGYKDISQAMGDYRMLERLGAGAFGEVWKVELPGGIMKAVKVIFRPIDHEEAKRELDSLELIKGLRHHFLLQTISFRPCDDRLFILMDLADGSLRDALKNAKKQGATGLPLQDVVRWTREAAEALDYLHDKGVQHRDIKPENILLSEGNVRVADFGLARHQATRRLVSGSGAGTPLYMPPEAWNDKVHANSDQYSLAATYAECRLGRRIYEADGLATLMHSHIHDKPKLDPLPAEEQKVLMKALAKNPDHRYPSCRAFADDLIRAAMKSLPPGALAGMPIVDVEAAPLMRRQREKQKQGRNLLLAIGFIGLLVVGAITAAILTRNGETVKDPKDLIALPAAGPAGPFRPVEGTEMIAVGEKQYPKQIECLVGGNPNLAVRFNYIPWNEKGKQSFYLMENKVSNEVYEAFAKANPSAVNGSRWRLGARGRPADPEKLTHPAVFPMVGLFAGPPSHWNIAATLVMFDPRPTGVGILEDWPNPDDLGLRDPRWPVLRVGIQEANLFAAWLGGVLPSVDEWDHAAGRYLPNAGDGPFEGPFESGTIAIERDGLGPLPIGTATRDQSKFSGCRDMAGNGLEWTRTYRFDGNFSEFVGDVRRVPLLAKVPTRGRSFNAETPLIFQDLDDRPLDLHFFETVRTPGSDSLIGFRVALIP